jgi:hypothetical protein
MKNRSLALTILCLTGLVGCATPSSWTAPQAGTFSSLDSAPKADGEIHPFLPPEIFKRSPGQADRFFLEVEGRVIEPRIVALW